MTAAAPSIAPALLPRNEELRKQLKREQRHVKWLKQHLPNSRQLYSAQQRIAELYVLEYVVADTALPTFDAATKKSDAEAPLSL